MRKEDLNEAIRNVDGDLVKAAEKDGRKVNYGRMKWISIATSAACFLLAAVIAVPAIKGTKNGSNGMYGEHLVDIPSDSGLPYKDGYIGYNGKTDSEESLVISGSIRPAPDSVPYKTATDSGYMIELPPSGGHIRYPDPGSIEISAGTLTAGEWKDIADLEAWVKLIRDNKWYAVAESRNLFSDNYVVVTVKSGEDACFNAKVELMQGEKVIYTAKTDISGKAYLYYNIDNKTDAPDAVRVGDRSYALEGKNDISIEAADAGVRAEKLDLMLMIDTTGSMSDELRYLSEELKDMVARIASKDRSFSIRVSVNFYRDEGDEYVVKYFDFRTDIDDCLKIISEQRADGGGDLPEAVHTALENAVNGHQWRNDAIKICFLVLDAPPHTESEIQGINAKIVSSVKDAAAQGIRMVPVLCSGSDDQTEYLCRSFAALTGGTFLFLTDDSGIGFSHHDPEVGEFDVEKLNEAMIRVVCEMCGFEYTKPVDDVQTQK